MSVFSAVRTFQQDDSYYYSAGIIFYTERRGFIFDTEFILNYVVVSR